MFSKYCKNSKTLSSKIEELEKNIGYCKTLLCNKLVLVYLKFSNEFQFTTDSTNFALGAIRSQERHSVRYAQRKLNLIENV